MLWAADKQGLSNIQQSQTHQVLKFQIPCQQMLLEPGEEKGINVHLPKSRDDTILLDEKWANTVAYLFNAITFSSSPNNHLHLEHVALADTWGDQVFQDISLV